MSDYWLKVVNTLLLKFRLLLNHLTMCFMDIHSYALVIKIKLLQLLIINYALVGYGCFFLNAWIKIMEFFYYGKLIVLGFKTLLKKFP